MFLSLIGDTPKISKVKGEHQPQAYAHQKEHKKPKARIWKSSWNVSIQCSVKDSQKKRNPSWLFILFTDKTLKWGNFFSVAIHHLFVYSPQLWSWEGVKYCHEDIYLVFSSTGKLHISSWRLYYICGKPYLGKVHLLRSYLLQFPAE